jgi:hypothetical protein
MDFDQSSTSNWQLRTLANSIEKVRRKKIFAAMVHKKAAAYRWRFVSRFVKTPSVCGDIFKNQSGNKNFCEL